MSNIAVADVTFYEQAVAYGAVSIWNFGADDDTLAVTSSRPTAVPKRPKGRHQVRPTGASGATGFKMVTLNTMYNISPNY
jgi:hypothetical protein